MAPKAWSRLSVDALDEAAAREQARSQGLTVLAAKHAAGGWRARGNPFAPRFPLGLFSQELLALLDAGLSLPESLETLAEKEGGAEQRRVLQALRDALFEGLPFSRALEQFPAIFPPLYVATVRASERTGDLGRALMRYVDYQARVDIVRKKVVSASIYPVVLMFVGGLVTLFLLAYVVPRFAGVYAESNRELPWLSRLLLEWGMMLNEHGGLVALAAALRASWCSWPAFVAIARLGDFARVAPAGGRRPHAGLRTGALLPHRGHAAARRHAAAAGARHGRRHAAPSAARASRAGACAGCAKAPACRPRWWRSDSPRRWRRACCAWANAAATWAK